MTLHLKQPLSCLERAKLLCAETRTWSERMIEHVTDFPLLPPRQLDTRARNAHVYFVAPCAGRLSKAVAKAPTCMVLRSGQAMSKRSPRAGQRSRHH